MTGHVTKSCDHLNSLSRISFVCSHHQEGHEVGARHPRYPASLRPLLIPPLLGLADIFLHLWCVRIEHIALAVCLSAKDLRGLLPEELHLPFGGTHGETEVDKVFRESIPVLLAHTCHVLVQERFEGTCKMGLG